MNEKWKNLFFLILIRMLASSGLVVFPKTSNLKSTVGKTVNWKEADSICDSTESNLQVHPTKGSEFQWVQRVMIKKSRQQLSKLYLGQKMNGRIITIRKYGMFVDIGAEQDGFLHIRDSNKHYFTHSMENQFYQGQDIDVWIQYIDAQNKKLRLQAFPLEESSPMFRSAVRDVELPIGSNITGTVTKLSEMGIFVDIGTTTMAYLHRRKMALPKKMYNYKPWEIFPLGSLVKGYVYDVDNKLGRVELTTYHPDCWDRRIPPREDVIHEISEQQREIEELAELSSTQRRKLLLASGLTAGSIISNRVPKRKLDASLDGTEDGSEEIDDDESKELSLEELEADEESFGEDLSREEIIALEKARNYDFKVKQAFSSSTSTDLNFDCTDNEEEMSILLDDSAEWSDSDTANVDPSYKTCSESGSGTATDDNASMSSKVREWKSSPFGITGELIAGVKCSTEDLFKFIGKGRRYLTAKEFIRWPNLQPYLVTNQLTEKSVHELIRKVAGHGMLKISLLDKFLKELGSYLGLKELPEPLDLKDIVSPITGKPVHDSTRILRSKWERQKLKGSSLSSGEQCPQPDSIPNLKPPPGRRIPLQYPYKDDVIKKKRSNDKDKDNEEDDNDNDGYDGDDGDDFDEEGSDNDFEFEDEDSDEDGLWEDFDEESNNGFDENMSDDDVERIEDD